MFKSLKEKLKGWVKKNEEKDVQPKITKKKKSSIKNKKSVENEKTEEKFFSKFKKKFTEEKFEELFEELEVILLQNNVSFSTVESIKESLSKELIGKIVKEISLADELKKSIESILINPPKFLEEIKNSLKEKVRS